MKLLIITIGFILIGLGIGYVDAIKSVDLWSSFYYIWDKLKDLLLVLCLIWFVPNKKIKRSLQILSSFFFIRIIWDLIAITTDYSTAASPQVMITMFLMWGIVIIYLMLQGVMEEWQH